MPTPDPIAALDPVDPSALPADRVDCARLARVVDRCFDLATDGATAPADQARYLAHGKRLRGLWLNLVSARFTAGTPALLAAHAALAGTTAALGQDLASIQASAAALSKLADLVSKLDAALEFVAKVV